ncbi:hypothetical protein Lal_00044076 [Lupinus albus]|uniref:Uncharacterized protein n=1 Tax=Lupinus albus TaxID=3870 RepID=A0A6A4PDW0_LUPAL|nr:hypothetical protein Lalb_Chr15g0087541 [Lupinus albus]KAF1895426.1 hypothetical protein Lal_00044076 [Lupinus albus]
MISSKRLKGRPKCMRLSLIEVLIKGRDVRNLTATPSSTDALSSSETAQTADGYEEQMVGRVVHGVIEGTFDGGYLVKVQLDELDDELIIQELRTRLQSVPTKHGLNE